MRKHVIDVFAAAVLGGLLAAPMPTRAAASVADLLEGANAALDSSRYVTADSLAERARSMLEEQARPDTVELATAHLAIARARIGQRSLADSVAFRSATKALELFERSTPEYDVRRADAHDALGLVLNEGGRADRALAHALRALSIRRASRGDVDEGTTRSYYRVGNTLKRLGRADSALVVLHEGLDFRLRLGLAHDRLIGDFHSDIAAVLEAQGKMDEARAELETTLHEYETRLSATHPAMCQGLQRYATFEFHNGDLAKSTDLAQRAVDIAEAAPDFSPANLALLRGNLAASLMELGDFVRARRVVEEVLPVFEERLGPRHRQTMWAKFLLGYAAGVAGDTLAALETLRDVQRTLESDSTATDTGTLGQTQLEIAQLLQDTDPKAALALAEKGERTERARPVPNPSFVVNSMNLQMRLSAKLARWNAVDSLWAKVERDLDGFDLRGSKAHGIALTQRCEAAAWQGRHADAVRIAREGSRVIRQSLVDNLRALPDREGMTLVSERCETLDVLVEQAAASASAGDAATAWDELIRWRGLVGAEIANRRDPFGPDLDSTAVRAHADWVEAQRRLAQSEVRAGGGASEELATLRANANDAERRWAAVAPTRGSPAPPLDVGLSDLRAGLKRDAALVAFATVKLRERPVRLYAFAVSGRDASRSVAEAVRAFSLGDIAPIEECLAQWRGLAGRSPQGDPGAERACREAGRRLRTLTWDPIVPALAGAHDVYLVPEGPLHALPWGALPDGDGYLVEADVRIHVLDAERDLVRADEPEARGGLLALGGVDFEGTAPSAEEAKPVMLAALRAVLDDCTSGIPDAFPPLPETRREVESIGRVWPGEEQVLVGGEATETMFKRLAPGRKVLHVATHGVVLEDSCAVAAPGTRGVGGVAPLESTKAKRVTVDEMPSPWLGRRVLLALAGANHAREHERDENDGLLSAEEVTTMDLRGTDWVVLSACQSGVAEVWDREGRLGMTRAFHLAGARAVIASQWPVDDESTREWMSGLYAARKDGALRAGDAIQRASRGILAARRADGRSTHPFYWAAFTSSGD